MDTATAEDATRAALGRIRDTAERLRATLAKWPRFAGRDELLAAADSIALEAAGALAAGRQPAAPTVIEGRPRLTDRQAAVLAFIAQHKGQHGYAPSVREIGDRFGIRSPNGVVYHLSRLRKKGYLRYTENVARSFDPIP